jgi:hypothetical protein
MGEQREILDLSGKHTAQKRGKSFENVSISAKIRAFQVEKKIASFEDAADALYAAEPELFKEESV